MIRYRLQNITQIILLMHHVLKTKHKCINSICNDKTVYWTPVTLDGGVSTALYKIVHSTVISQEKSNIFLLVETQRSRGILPAANA